VLPQILHRTSAEENAIILLAAPAIYKTLSELNYSKKIDELTEQLRVAKHESQARNNAVFQMEERITSAISQKLSEIDTEVLRSVDNIQVSPDPKLARGMEKLEDTMGLLVESIGGIASRNGQDDTKRLEQFMQRIEKTVSNLSPAAVSSPVRKTPQQIGAENEKFMNKLITDTFATPGAGFAEIRDGKFRSCDHIFRWNGLTIMVEDKKYALAVQNKETEKAVRDFDLHPESDVLIMISMDSAIRGHETADGIDSMIYENRLILFLSNFADRGDPHMYIRRVVQPILIASKTLLAKLREDPEKTSERFQYAFQAIPAIMSAIHDQENNLASLITNTTNSVNAVKYSLNAQHFQLKRLLEVFTGKDEAIRGTESVVARLTGSQNDDDKSDDDVQPAIKQSIPVDNVHVKASSITCSNCGGVGHNARSCKNLKAVRVEDNTTGSIKCSRCAGAGHNKRTCTKPTLKK